MLARLAPLLVALTLASACAPEPAPRDRRAAIFNGAPYSGHPSVGELLLQGGGACTATLVGKQTVLTAAHCIDAGVTQTFVAGGASYLASAAHVHPSYDPQTLAHDIAVVRLAQAPAIAPSVIATSAPWVGLEVTLVGYGVTSTQGTDAGTKRIARATIAQVNAHDLSWNGAAGGTCYGDSGGPAFAAMHGLEVEVGVTSWGTDPCGTTDYDTRVDAHADWIAQVAGGDVQTGRPPATPPPSPGPRPEPGAAGPSPAPHGGFGASCQRAADCSSGLCAVDHRTQSGFCTVDCSPSGAACPGSAGCELAAGNRFLCGPPAGTPAAPEAPRDPVTTVGSCSAVPTAAGAGWAATLLLLFGLTRRTRHGGPMRTDRSHLTLGFSLALLALLGACAGDRPDHGGGAPPASTPPLNLVDGGPSPAPPAGSADGAPPPAPAPSGTGTKTCAEIDACAAACNDASCAAGCLQQGTADAQAKLNALDQCDASAQQGTCKSQCADTSSQGCGQCLDSACAAQLAACLGGTPGSPSPSTPPPPGTPPPGSGTGTKTCGQIMTCLQSCAEIDSACQDQCFSDGSADGQAKMAALEQCALAAEQGTCKSQCANADGQGCWNCLDQACAAQLQACQ